LKDGQHRCTGTVRPQHLELKIEVIGTTAPEGYKLKALKICARAYVKMYVEDETQDNKDDELTWYGTGDYHFVDCGAWGEVANCITEMPELRKFDFSFNDTEENIMQEHYWRDTNVKKCLGPLMHAIAKSYVTTIKYQLLPHSCPEGIKLNISQWSRTSYPPSKPNIKTMPPCHPIGKQYNTFRTIFAGLSNFAFNSSLFHGALFEGGSGNRSTTND
jgi:hypothetical protein